MYSLEHYNLFPDFSLREAAYLAVGIDPRAMDSHASGDAVLEQMSRSVREMFRYITHFDVVPKRKDFHPEHLVPTALDSMHYDHPPHRPINMIAAANANKLFCDKSSELRFERAEIERWFIENGNGYVPKYQFDFGRESKADSPTEKINGRWPWGSHETELLRQLEAAAKRFWGENYDPADDETAPTNQQVVDWLLPRVGDSRRIAEAIATLLRKDGLKPGPRGGA